MNHARIRYPLRRATATAAALLAALVIGAYTAAQPGDDTRTHAPDAQPGIQPIPRAPDQPRPAPEPPLAPSVRTLLEAPYLSEAERAHLRIFHGAWTEADIDRPATMARIALLTGALDDPTLEMPDAPAIDRAEAALLRGEPDRALRLLEGDASSRAARIRAEALTTLGRFDEAVAAIDVAVDRLGAGRATTPDQIVEGVRALAIRARLRGAQRGPRDYEAMMATLGAVTQQIDRHHWPAVLAEAELLYDKDNRPEAAEALQRVLSLNPRSARAWRLLGRLHVDGFDIPSATQAAARLDELAQPGVSPWAGQIRARAMLRLQDPDAALEALEPILDAYPENRRALALQAAAEAARFDFPRAARLLERFDELSPGSPDAYYEVGRVLSEARQYEEAAAHLETAHARMPTWPAPVIDLGLLELQSGRDAHALAALQRAAELDPFNVRARNSLELVRELRTYHTLESENFIVRYRDGPDAILAEEMIEALEQIHDVVTSDKPGGIDHQPDRRTVIELMPNHRWFAVRIVGMPQIHTVAAATGPVIALETPREGRGHSGTYDWVRTVRHEYAHTVTLSRTRNRIPHWFTEAAAVYLELAPRDYSTAQLLADALRNNELFDLAEINTAFVRPRRRIDRSLAYAQGHWMYEFMLDQWGARAPLQLMDLYAAGEREESAFRSVLGVSRSEFLDRFKRWARAQVIEWGLQTPRGTPTIPQLLEREAQRLEAEEETDTPTDRSPRITDELLARWLEEHPEHPDILGIIAERRLRADDGDITPETEDILRRYMAARPVDPLPHQALARHYLDSDDPARAIPHLEFLDAREQRSATYAVELARRYAAAGDLENASRAAVRATRIAPFNAGYRELAATIALRRNDTAGAQRHIRALTVIEPDRDIHQRRLEAITRMIDEETDRSGATQPNGR